VASQRTLVILRSYDNRTFFYVTRTSISQRDVKCNIIDVCITSSSEIRDRSDFHENAEKASACAMDFSTMRFVASRSLIQKSRLPDLSPDMYAAHFYKQRSHVDLPGWSSIYWGSYSPLADNVPCPSGCYVRRRRLRRPNERQWYWQNCTWSPPGRRFRYPVEKRADESSRGSSGSSLCVSKSLVYLRKSWRGSGTCNHSSAAAESAMYSDTVNWNHQVECKIWERKRTIFFSELPRQCLW